MENRRLSTCNRLDLQTLGFWPSTSKYLRVIEALWTPLVWLRTRKISAVDCASTYLKTRVLPLLIASLPLGNFIGNLGNPTETSKIPRICSHTMGWTINSFVLQTSIFHPPKFHPSKRRRKNLGCPNSFVDRRMGLCEWTAGMWSTHDHTPSIHSASVTWHTNISRDIVPQQGDQRMVGVGIRHHILPNSKPILLTFVGTVWVCESFEMGGRIYGSGAPNGFTLHCWVVGSIVCGDQLYNVEKYVYVIECKFKLQTMLVKKCVWESFPQGGSGCGSWSTAPS